MSRLHVLGRVGRATLRGTVLLTVAQGNIVESAIDADVAHGRETGKKCDARVGNGGVSTFGRGFLQHKERFGVAQVGKVRVAIDQSRQNSHF